MENKIYLSENLFLWRKKMKQNEFNHLQKSEIYLGRENGLTEEQVAVYAKPEFDFYQMAEIRKGYENSLTEEQVAVYAKPIFNSSQMREIRWGYENGLTDEQIAVYAKPEFDCNQMKQIRWGYEKGLTYEQILVYLNANCEEEEDLICNCFKQGISIEQVQLLINSGFNLKKMKRIVECIWEIKWLKDNGWLEI